MNTKDDVAFLAKMLVMFEMSAGYIRCLQDVPNASASDIASVRGDIVRTLTCLLQDAPQADVCTLDMDVWGEILG